MLLNLITVPAVYAEEPDDPCAGFFPTDVENVNAQPLNAAVKLSWDPSEDDASVAGYDVYYGEQSIDEDDAEYPSSVDAGDALEYIVDGLENDIQYYFAVIAYDEEDPRNESVCWSIEASATPAEDAGEVNATDTEAPQVTDETEALNMEEVKVVFTEAVELPEEDPELAFAVEDDETFEALEVLDAVIDEDDETGATVIITTAAQTEDVVYKLTAGIDVSDRAGNSIISGTSDTAIFTGSAVVKEEVDEEAPVLLAVETIDSTHVGLTFSEAIIVDIDPATNFDITAEEDSSVVLDVLGVKLGPDSEGADDAYAIVTTSVQEERAYVITAKGLDDEAGNTIDSATNAVLFAGIPGVSAGDDDDDDANNIGSIGDCAGYYAGNYAGALNGGVDGYLNQDGSLELEFYVEGDVMYGSGQTSSSGAIVGSSSGLIALDGELDFSDCTAKGSWSSNYAGSGSWTVFPD